ncbi:MAG TPA: hypothetical protein VID95_02040 [Candidatus Limnocylindrales bacterium]
MKWLIAIALLVAACTPAAVSSGPSGAVLAATGQPGSTPDPCRTAVTGLAAFTQQLSGDVGDIKDPLAAKPFVAADAAVASFRVSAMLTSFRLDELVTALRACPATADLGTRVTGLVAAMNKVLDEARSASISNAQAQRAAAAALVGMLPDVTALAKANDQAAATIGGTAAGAAGAAGDWTADANTYLESTFETYATTSAAAADLARIAPVAAGLSAAESASRIQQATAIVDRAAAAVARHLQAMQASQAGTCYADAYAADRTIAGRWQSLLVDGAWPGDATADARATAGAYTETVTQTATFLGSMPTYFADCK